MRHKKRKFKINGYVLFSALILIVLVFIQTFLLTQPKITSKNDDTTQTSTKNSTAKRFPDQVRKGINTHDYFIKKYAYAADKIRKYITGEEPYKGEKLVFLTFDDGVNNQITPQVLDTLKSITSTQLFSCRKYPNFRKSKDSETRSCRRTFNRLS